MVRCTFQKKSLLDEFRKFVQTPTRTENLIITYWSRKDTHSVGSPKEREVSRRQEVRKWEG
jgi:hypothetical protein